MKFNDTALGLLDRYKYQNLPLEETLSLLANALGYDLCSQSLQGESAQLLCNWKWGKITLDELALKLNTKAYFYSYQGMGY